MTKDRVFRTRAELLGGHYHVDVFSAPHSEHGFARIGTLVMDEDDYPNFVASFEAEHRLLPTTTTMPVEG